MDHVDKIISQWEKQRADINTAPMALIGRIKRVSAFFSAEMGRTFGQHGLNAASFDILATLRRSGAPYALSPSRLMEETMVTSGTMTNRIDQLVKAGLVKRIRNPKDGRGFLISLTERGFEVIEKALTDHVKTQKRLVENLSASQYENLNKALKQLLEPFEAMR